MIAPDLHVGNVVARASEPPDANSGIPQQLSVSAIIKRQRVRVTGRPRSPK